MSAFIRGLQAGTAAAQGWVDTYEAARKRREEKELKESLKRAGEIEQTTVALPESYAPAAPTESQQVTTQYGLRTPTPNEIGRARAETQALAEQDAQTFQEYQAGGLSRYGTPFSETEVQRARTEAMARAYEQAGNPAEAMRMRQLAQQQEATGLQLESERRRAQREQANQTALQQVAEAFSQGNQLDVPNIYQIASETGADPSLLVRAAADNLELTQKRVDSINKQLIQNIRTASTSPDKFNKLLSEQFDPDPTDNIKPELRQVGNGYQVFYGDRQISPMFRDDKDISALSQLSQYYQNQIQGKPLETAVQVATLEKLRSGILKDKAEAAAAGPKAAALGLDRQIKVAGEIRQQIEDLRKELQNLDPNSEAGKRLARRIDAETENLFRVNQSINNAMFGQPASATKVGDTINVNGTVYKKSKSGPDSDRNTWELVEGKEAPPSAAPSSAARQAPAEPTVGLGGMGARLYGRFSPDSVIAEGVRRNDPEAIRELQRRRDVEAARGLSTPGYNQLGVY